MDAALTPSSHVILGLLAVAGPLTAYDLKSAIARSVGYLWPFPHAQVYKEAARLAALGLLVEEQEATGRRRRQYAITPAGRVAVGAWLESPTEEPAQLRDPGLLKLAFASLATPEGIVRLCDERARGHRSRRAVYAGLADVPMDRFLRATLDFGLRHEELMAAEWERLRSSIGQADDRAAAPAGSHQHR